MNESIKIYQIYYDEVSRNHLDPNFIQLDNSKNLHSDWYEFSAIRDFLQSNPLEVNTFYGFLSPNFQNKTGYKSSYIYDFIDKFGARFDCALFSIRWDQLAFFKNPFEQGECAHPGILKSAQKFLDSIQMNIDLTEFITYSQTSVFSNYIIAKPIYWTKWLELANKFYEYAALNPDVLKLTNHRDKKIPLKVFIQERLSSLILANCPLKVATPDQSLSGPIIETYFHNDSQTRRRLICCDTLKERYCNTGNINFLKMYYQMRKEIILNNHSQSAKIAKLIIDEKYSFFNSD